MCLLCNKNFIHCSTIIFLPSDLNQLFKNLNVGQSVFTRKGKACIFHMCCFFVTRPFKYHKFCLVTLKFDLLLKYFIVNFLSAFLCRQQSIAHIGITLCGVCLSVCLSCSHTFVVVMHSYISQATHVFLEMLPLCSCTKVNDLDLK